MKYYLWRLISKIKRELWRSVHPRIWGRNLQINGIPSISGEGDLIIGEHVSINDDVVIQLAGDVTIGDNVTISRGCVILTTGLDTNNYRENSQKMLRDHIVKNVIIEDNVWIAANVTITPGSVIPKGAIIAAGAVVTGILRDEYALYGGVPAKKIKKLN